MSSFDRERYAHRYVDGLVAVADEMNGRDLATVEQILSGPTTRPEAWWIVVLYRNSEVSDGTQLIGVGDYLVGDESEDELRRLLRRFWSDVINEPPGTDLPNENLRDEGIAWWRGLETWNHQTGPPDDGQPAVRAVRLDEQPPNPRTAVFNAMKRAEDALPLPHPHIHATGIAVGPDYAGFRLISTTAASASARTVADEVERYLRASLPTEVRVDVQIVVDPAWTFASPSPAEWDALLRQDVQWTWHAIEDDED